MNSSSTELHLNLDDAWPNDSMSLATLDLRNWGPQLRFSGPARLVETFYREVGGALPPFLLYGSGDFHHLTALWVRRFQEPLAIVSFDNHPDWDVRPPKWCCGGWVNRALEVPHVQQVSVWGCGNFECWWPGQFFGNRRAEREGRLEVHPWADNLSPAKQERCGAILQSNWRERFGAFVGELKGGNVYITIDLDCLRPNESITNWENGKFTVPDLEWAVQALRGSARILGGDICGAYSTPRYARRKQRFVAEWDHPKLLRPDLEAARRINHAALARLWPILTE